jgi:glycosyltransferase involved in cell wall biosynthesis
MTDITLLYYTANRIPEPFAEKVRDHLLNAAHGKPIISISQKPIDFGKNICVAIEPSRRGIYVQMLVGAMACNTKYVALCEDDCLYVPEHFEYEPKNGFAYNMNQWHLRGNVYFYRGHMAAWVCIAPTELLIKNTQKRLLEHPGNEDIKMKIPRETFQTEIPVITIRHKNSLDGVPSIPNKYKRMPEIPYWGGASELWRQIDGI